MVKVKARYIIHRHEPLTLFDHELIISNNFISYFISNMFLIRESAIFSTLNLLVQRPLHVLLSNAVVILEDAANVYMSMVVNIDINLIMLMLH